VSLGFYTAFEDRYRGSTDLVQKRLAVYEPLARAVGGPVLDLGCGRGEWLTLLRSWAIPARGVDLETSMVTLCQAQGHEVACTDAISALRAYTDASLSLVSALHLVEHLPFETLNTLMRESLRVLRPGGVLLLETPNAENLLVGAHEFYTDPTHQRPIPANLLRFLPEHHGFGRVEMLRLHELLDEQQRLDAGLLGALAGVSMDYAVIAMADEAPGTWAALDSLVTQLRGVSLQEACAGYDQRRYEQLNAISTRLDGHEQQLHELSAQARVYTEQVRIYAEQVLAMQRSMSWRITAPLRFAGQLLRRIARRVVRRDSLGRIHLSLRMARSLQQAIRTDDSARLLVRDARDLWEVSESSQPKR